VSEPNIPLSPAQRSKVRRLAAWQPPAPGEEAGELNIVPYLDIVMNIIVFIIASLTLVFVTTIDTTPPSLGGGKTRDQIKSKALNLTALITGEGISLKTSSGNIATGCGSIGSGVTVPKSNNRQNYPEITRCVRELKRQNERFAEETQVTLTANPDIDYQVVVSVIDALRKDNEGPLFPDVHFGVAR
jgi:biopolymer transport protein TolR